MGLLVIVLLENGFYRTRSNVCFGAYLTTELVEIFRSLRERKLLRFASRSPQLDSSSNWRYYFSPGNKPLSFSDLANILNSSSTEPSTWFLANTILTSETGM